mmetsp:Transcript_11927/g.27834  ORF Transcript_11927/g.27834 Transcript_11927/m.27834 type:complete len:730 (-) Transcript_11927:167-2356(-)
MPSLGCTLRFPDSECEEAFVQQHDAALRRNTTVAAVVLGLACVAAMVWKWVYQASAHARSDALLFGATALHAIQIAIIISVVAHIQWAGWKFYGRLGLSAAELSLAAGLLLCILLNMLIDDNVLSQFLGLDVPLCQEGEDPYLADSETLSFLLGFLVVPHLFLPVRWYVLWPCEFFAVVGFTIDEVALRGTSIAPAVTTAGFLLVTCAIAVGKLNVELFYRDSFEMIRDVKLQRMEAEGNLHELYVKRRTIFDLLSAPRNHRKEDLVDALQHVAAMGDMEHWLLSRLSLKMIAGTDGAITTSVSTEELVSNGSPWTLERATLHGTPVLVKMPAAGTMDNIHHALPELQTEMRNLRRLRHPNIIHFHGAFVEPESCMLGIVLESFHGVSLHAFATESPLGRPASDRRMVALDVCSAMRYMHGLYSPVVHGRLQASAVAVELQGKRPLAKIMDLGAAKPGAHFFDDHNHIRRTSTTDDGHSMPWPGFLGRRTSTADDGHFVSKSGFLGSWTLSRRISFDARGRRSSQSSEHRGSVADDVAALGTLLLFIMTGVEEPWSSSDMAAWRAMKWMSVFIDVCEDCVSDEPDDRPSSQEVHLRLVNWQLPTSQGTLPLSAPGSSKPSSSTQASRQDVLEGTVVDIKLTSAAVRDSQSSASNEESEPDAGVHSPDVQPAAQQLGKAQISKGLTSQEAGSQHEPQLPTRATNPKCNNCHGGLRRPPFPFLGLVCGACN